MSVGRTARAEADRSGREEKTMGPAHSPPSSHALGERSPQSTQYVQQFRTSHKNRIGGLGTGAGPYGTGTGLGWGKKGQRIEVGRNSDRGLHMGCHPPPGARLALGHSDFSPELPQLSSETRRYSQSRSSVPAEVNRAYPCSVAGAVVSQPGPCRWPLPSLPLQGWQV